MCEPFRDRLALGKKDELSKSLLPAIRRNRDRVDERHLATSLTSA